MLLAFIPFIGWVALAMMLCTASNPEANRFGENPYEEGYYHPISTLVVVGKGFGFIMISL